MKGRGHVPQGTAHTTGEGPECDATKTVDKEAGARGWGRVVYSHWKKRERRKGTGEFVNYNLSACHRSPQATAKRDRRDENAKTRGNIAFGQ